MTKKIEKFASLSLFILMFVFLNQLEAGVLPFFVALSGMISCGCLSVIFLMRGADLSFKLSLEYENAPHTETPCAEPAYTDICPPTLRANIRPEINAAWCNKTNAA